MERAFPLLFGLLSTALVACGGASTSFGPSDAGPLQADSGTLAIDSGSISPPADDAGTTDDASTADASPPSGPSYEVHLRATQTPVTFSDGYSGETPLDQRMGVRKLTLLRDANDPSPVVVFDNGANGVDAAMNDGSDTVCGTALASTLPAGTFTIARVTVGYYKFTVAAVLHDNGQAVPGDYTDLEVLTSGTNFGGQTYDQGYYSFTFEVAGTSYGAVTGGGMVTPVDDSTGGISLVTSAGEVDYVLAVNLQTNPALTSTAKVVLTVNTYENFRWQDQSGPGYATGVFDTTPTTYEPVMSFGANSFTLSVE
jgi:hypothetical protein